MILAWTGDELSRGQAQNRVNFYFEVKFDLGGQGQSPPEAIGILTKVFYTYGPNLVILAWTEDELLCRQASDYRTHGRTFFSMNKPTTWCKSGRVSLVSSSCLYKTQPERALAQVCHTRIDALSPDEYQFHLLLHRNSHHSQATYPKWLNH